MASEYRKIMLMQIKNGVCLLCIFALMLLLAACFSLYTCLLYTSDAADE